MSRYWRKHQFGATPPGSTWWAPNDRGWWIGVLFAIGSLLFALGAMPGYAGLVGISADSETFFAGSIFFTSAGFLTYREAVDAGERPARAGTTTAPASEAGRRRRRFFVFEPRRIDWWATAIQLLGTVFFNVSTGNALSTDLSAQSAYQSVWIPDAFGSTCFLVASGLAWGEACRGWFAWKPGSWAWWITLVNLLGSVAFGVSATADYISPQTGQIQDAERANLGTFIGALCFLAGALMLLPERTKELDEAAATASASAGGGGG